MAEFKFSCPQCNQRIQCDAGYAGTQINCPSCHQAIIVPQAPGASAPPPVPATPAAPAAGLATRQSTAAPAAGKRFAGAPGSQPPPPKKSGGLKIAVGVTAALVGVAVGFFAVTFALKHFGGGKAKGNPAAQVAAPTAAASIQALSILTKVHAAYTNLNTATANGSFTMFLDISNLTAADMNPNMAADNKNAKRHPAGMPHVITNSTELTIKRASTNWVYLVCEAVTKADRMTFTNTFAFWSSDKGRFMFTDSHRTGPYQTMYRQLPDASASDFQMQQLVTQNAQQIFQDPGQMAKIIKNLGQTDDEMIEGVSCYTLTAKILGQKVKVWVDKTTYLVSRWEITLGGQVTDADIDDLFDVLATAAQLPKAQLDAVKPKVKQSTAAIAKIRGTLSSTTRNLEINPTLASDDFDYAVPKGVRLVQLSTNRVTRVRSARPATTTTTPATKP